VPAKLRADGYQGSDGRFACAALWNGVGVMGNRSWSFGTVAKLIGCT
jgi:hypothetical protein